VAALTAGMNRPGATAADLGPGGPPAARTTGPAGGDRSAAVSSGTRTVRSWPLLVLAAPAAAEVWSGWAGIAQKTGFGLVSPLPGIWPSLHLDTSITLPVGVEAYAAYALRAWLAGGHPVSGRPRPVAKWAAICSFAPRLSPPAGSGRGGAGAVAGHHDRVLPACRSWSWPWAPPWPTCCAPTPDPATGRGDRPQAGPPPGPARTRPGHPRTSPRAQGHPPEPVLPPGQQRSRGRTTAPARGPVHRVRPRPARYA